MGNDELEQLEDEVNFLRYFYKNARAYMGPADSECYGELKEIFKECMGYLPKGYELTEEEE